MFICGIQYYCYVGDSLSEVFWYQQYVENLIVEEKCVVLIVVEVEVWWFDLWVEQIWGLILEDCGLQIIFLVFGQNVFVDVKKVWDLIGEKKNSLCEVVQVLLLGFEV